MRRAASLLLLSFAVVVASGAACDQLRAKEKKITLYPVGHTAALALEIDYPNDEGEDETCGPAAYRRSYLLSIDTGTPGWDIRLLFDGSLATLYGCGAAGTACEDAALGFTLDAPQRVMLEALDVTPSEYAAATSGISVLCRGIADAGVVAADVTSTVSPDATPEEDPAPDPVTVVTTYTVKLRMLQVGGTNRLPFEIGGPAPASVRYGAAASFSDDAFHLGATGGLAGHVAFAGGVSGEGAAGAQFSNEIYLFDPATLAFSSAGTLSSARAGLTATTFRAADGTSSILFAGGIVNAASPAMSNQAEIMDSTGAVSQITMETARGFHAATYTGTSMNMVLVAGGELWDPEIASGFAGNGAALTTFEYFAPAASVPSPTPSPCAQLGSGDFCSTGSDSISAARSALRAEYLHRSDEIRHMVLIGGQNDNASANSVINFQVEANSSRGGGFAAGTLANNSAFPATAVLGYTGVAGLDYMPVSFGGFSVIGSLAANGDANYFPSEAGDAFVRDMIDTRGLAQATTLRDSTVLITGGTAGNTSGLRAIERFVPFAAATLDSSARFEVIAPVGITNCDPLTGNNCARLSTPRFAHTATRLQQTRTWLDGAVLVIGGAAPLERAAELFVPPMTCDATTHLLPVSPGTGVAAEPFSNPTLPPLCDRDRAGETVTNPLTGAPN